MIDYEEELKKFEPCLDVADVEGAIIGDHRYHGCTPGDAAVRSRATDV